jgi:hypothetical protein
MSVGFGVTVVRLARPGSIAETLSTTSANIRQRGGLSGMNTESIQRDRRRMTRLCRLTRLSFAAPLLLVGCSHGPEYSIFGSFFPAWIFCSIGGLVLAACARALIARTAISEYLAAPVLFYLSAAIFFTCMLWLLFYN